MALSWAPVALFVAVVFLALMLLHARRTRRAWAAWQAVLLDDAGTSHQLAQAEVRAHLVGFDASLTLARSEDAAGAGQSAARVLRRAAQSAMRLARRLDGWLRAWRDMARALKAVQPAPPLSPRAFRSWGLRALAGLHHALDFLCVTRSRRFAARIGIVRIGLRSVRRAFARVAREVRSARALASPAWRAQDARANLAALADACLATLRSLEASKASVRASHARH